MAIDLMRPSKVCMYVRLSFPPFCILFIQQVSYPVNYEINLTQLNKNKYIKGGKTHPNGFTRIYEKDKVKMA